MTQLSKYIVITSITDKKFSFTTVEGSFDEPKFPQVKDFKINKGDRVFFMDGCTVPRFKIREVIKNFGASICKKQEDATIIIGNERFENSFLNNPMQPISADYFIQWLNRCFPVGSIHTMTLINTIRISNAQVILLESDIYQQLMDEFTPGFVNETFIDDDDGEVMDKYNYGDFYTLTEEGVKAMKGERKVIPQDKLLELINVNNVTMDKKMFDEIREMFLASDRNNRVLAMEIMANCDYNKSFLYLSLLFREFKSEIGSQRERNHVNFKALINFLDYPNLNSYPNISIDDITNKMREKKLLTRTTMEQLIPVVTDEMTVSLDSTNFELKVIPSSELEAEIVNDEPEEELDIPTQDLNSVFDL